MAEARRATNDGRIGIFTPAYVFLANQMIESIAGGDAIPGMVRVMATKEEE